MRNVLILISLFLLTSLTLPGATYYVATTGNDSNAGTISAPFATWSKLNSVLVAGDIAYIRGGVYRTKAAASADFHVSFRDLKGTSSSPISIQAYPGESPVFNMDNISSTAPTYCMVFYVSGCTYLQVKGLRITGYSQPSSGIPVWGMAIASSPNCTFEQLTIDHIGGYGISCLNGTNNVLFKNCDVHHCADRYGNPNGNNKSWEDANGYGVTGGSTATNITYDGCRAWNISDDGWDFFATDGVYTLKNCWSFWNGYDDSFTPLGNGQGFKLGPNATNKGTQLSRTITNCIAAQNKNGGFDQNTADYSTLMQFYNNAAFYNGAAGFQFSYAPAASVANVFRNNVAFANAGSQAALGGASVQSNNTWNSGVTVTNADFASIDVSELARPRKADGSLPDISLLHLVSGSDLIDKGLNVGLPYTGSAPDMGPFEMQSGGSAPVVPVLVSSAIENATPSVLDLTYSVTMANVVPAVSSFSVLVNSVARTVNSVAISGTKVQLTLASPVATGNVVTIAYTIPAATPLQSALSVQAATFAAQAVTNKVSSVSPVYVSSSVENTTPTLLDMTYNLSLAGTAPATSAFIVQVNSVNIGVTAVAITTTKVRLTLASAVKFGDVITVAYTKPATNPLQSAAGMQAVTLTAKAVTNNLVNPTKDPSVFSITTTINPNPVHRIMNLLFVYTGTYSKLDPAASPQIIRIVDKYGRLRFEKLVSTGVSNSKFAVNLRPGVYTVLQLSGGVQKSTQQLMVY